MTVSIFSNQFSLSPGDKATIIRSWWPGVDDASPDDYQTYFSFFHQELKNIPWRNVSPKFGAQTLEDMMRVVQILSDHQDRPRSAIVAELRNCLPFEEDSDDVPIIRSMELAVRLWLGLNVQTWGIAVPSEMPRISLIQWTDKTSLIDMAKEAFQKHEPGKQRSRISPGFSAWKLIYLCGVKIDWTDSLSDHLRFDHGSKILMIYRHKICLLGHWTGTLTHTKPQEDDGGSKKNDMSGSGHRPTSSVDLEAAAEKIGEIREVSFGQEERSASKGKEHMSIQRPTSPHGSSKKDDSADKRFKGNPLPRDLLEETMRTLDLLFPFTGDEETRVYLKSEGQTFNQIRTPEGLGLPPRALDFSEFRYWRGRLEDIHDLFTSPPRTNTQLWRDRRNRKDFLALVISILALSLAMILGIIGLVNAVRSNDQAKKSYDLAERSFNLALAQACARHDIVQSMCPSFPRKELS